MFHTKDKRGARKKPSALTDLPKAVSPYRAIRSPSLGPAPIVDCMCGGDENGAGGCGGGGGGGGGG